MGNILVNGCMQNEQNQDRLWVSNNYKLMKSTYQEESSMRIVSFSEDQQQIDQEPYLTNKHGLFSNQIDFVAVDSYTTLQRESLKILPESLQLSFHSKNDDDLAPTLISSHNSQIFQEYGSTQNEMALIRQTEDLTLKQCATSIEYQGQKDNGQVERTNRKYQPRFNYIKNARQLIRQLKRQHKYGNTVKGDTILTIDEKVIKLKSATLRPIIDDKKHLSAIIVSHSEQQYKIQVRNQGMGYFDPRLQLWDNEQQCWSELQFKIKLQAL